MITLLIEILLLWLVYKYAPYGDKIIAVIVCITLLKWFGVIPAVICL